MKIPSNCPGSQRFKQPEPEIIKCSNCGKEIEIWTDEISAKCPECREAILHPVGHSCLDWCKYAKECVGETVYKRFSEARAVTVKEKLIEEMQKFFGSDKKRIEHAKKVLGFSEEILKKEKGDWHIVVAASILHDIGIKAAEEKYGSAAGHYQEKEGPPLAKKILLEVGLKMEDINEICEIISRHHSPGKINTQNFKILYDADCLVNLRDEADTKDMEKLSEVINKVFLTDAGKALAERIYL